MTFGAARDRHNNYDSAQYLENKSAEFHQILLSIHIDKILLRIATCHFSHICTRVMALDLRQNFVSAQYLLEQIDRMSPNFIYALILTSNSIGLLHIIFRTFGLELSPLIYANISFLFNIFRTN